MDRMHVQHIRDELIRQLLDAGHADLSFDGIRVHALKLSNKCWWLVERLRPDVQPIASGESEELSTACSDAAERLLQHAPAMEPLLGRLRKTTPRRMVRWF